MSLFKTREWWSTTVGDNEMFDTGCLCVADLNASETDKVIVGSFHGRLAIYSPASTKGQDRGRLCKAEDVICEVQLSDPILQVDCGRFVSGSDSMHVAVLHPRKLAVFGLTSVPGLTEHGAQYQLRSLYEHKFQRTAFNFCHGPFGGVKGRDFICVQSIDGTVSVFEQESFTFTRFLPGALLPGPIRYVARTDSIVTVSSSRQVDSFKFQVLATAKDEGTKDTQNVVKGKRVTADWSLLINETSIDLVVTNFADSPLTIFVLGERNLYALSEAGQLVFCKKFDFDPACFIPYAAGKNDTVRYIVASHNTNTLMAFEGTRMMWAAQLVTTPVQLKVARFRELTGVIVTLDDEGHLSCLYLGTDPSLLSHPLAYTRALNYAAVNAEMKELQNIIKEHEKKGAAPTPSQSIEEDLKVTIDVPPGVDRSSSKTLEVEIEDEIPIPSITVTISLKAKIALHNVKLTCSAVAPLVTDNTVTVLPSVAPGNPAEVKVVLYMKQKLLPSDLRVTAHATYYTNTGAPRIVQASAYLPLLLVMRPSMPVKNATYKLTIDTNQQPVALDDLFADLWSKFCEDSAHVVAFKYYGLDPVITILASKSSQRYRIQCDTFGFMWHVLNDLTRRLAARFKMGSSSDFRIYYSGDLPLQEYCETIEQHFQYRYKNDALLKTLEGHAAQFRSTQKRLLILYKDKTPTPLKGLDTLLDDTFKQIMLLTDAIEANNKRHEMLSAELSCATHVVIHLLKLKLGLPQEEVAALENVLTPVVNDSQTQGWEEIVDAAVMHVLRMSLAKSSKDISLNPSPLCRLKDTSTLVKHIAMLFERITNGSRLSDASSRQPASLDRPAVGAKSRDGASGKAVGKKASSVSIDGDDGGTMSTLLNGAAGGEPTRTSTDNWETAASHDDEDYRGVKDQRRKQRADVGSDVDGEVDSEVYDARTLLGP